MLFTEFRFFAFFSAVFGVYWLLSDNRKRKMLLLVSSYIFYAAWNWKFLILIVLSTLIDFFIGLKLGAQLPDSATARWRRQWIMLSVSWNLGVLFFFKYFNFGIDSARALLNWLGLQTSIHELQIILPVGISFFTFQSMSYSIDIYRRKLEPCTNLLDFATFIGFFPQLFSGPIVRAIDFLPQLRTVRSLGCVPVRAMMTMFMVGFIKKACIADNLAPVVDDYFANPSQYNWLGCWTAVMAYSVQIYCDFSGYTDMAIATAGLLGFEFNPNFDFPYFSSNIAEFWRRWHMSLSSWLRDYLYIPLGGNRGGKILRYKNLFLTMLLGGLWHGASWTFVVWGAIHGLALIVHREFQDSLHRRNPAAASMARFVHKIAGVLLTFLAVSTAWIFFRSPDLATALFVTKSFLSLHSAGTADFGAVVVGIMFALSFVHWISYQRLLQGWWQGLPRWQFAAGCGVILDLALTVTPLGYKPFIYFQF